jgi:hypothetical protein
MAIGNHVRQQKIAMVDGIKDANCQHFQNESAARIHSLLEIMGLVFNLQKDSRFDSIVQYPNLITQSPAHSKMFRSLSNQLHKSKRIQFQTFVSVLRAAKAGATIHHVRQL